MTERLIWCSEHRGFWKHDNEGYSENVSDARRFSLAEADETVLDDADGTLFNLPDDARAVGWQSNVLLTLKEQDANRLGLDLEED